MKMGLVVIFGVVLFWTWGCDKTEEPVTVALEGQPQTVEAIREKMQEDLKKQEK